MKKKGPEGPFSRRKKSCFTGKNGGGKKEATFAQKSRRLKNESHGPKKGCPEILPRKKIPPDQREKRCTFKGGGTFCPSFQRGKREFFVLNGQEGREFPGGRAFFLLQGSAFGGERNLGLIRR